MKPTGCIRCGAAGDYPLHPLKLVACGDCYLVWIRDESLSVESVLRVVGEWNPIRETYKQHDARFDAELLKRTLAWARAGREAA